MNVLYLSILHGDLSLNFACSIVPQKSSIIQKIKQFYVCQKMFSTKQQVCSLKKMGITQ